MNKHTHAFGLGIWRDIRKSLPRFLSIFAIVALGTGFYAGVAASAGDMRMTVREYLKEQKLADLHILSPVGLDDEELRRLQETDGVTQATGAYSADMLLEVGGQSAVCKLLSYDERGLNQPYITEGRLPQATDECVLDNSSFAMQNFKVGDTIRFFSGDDNDTGYYLKQDTFTVVGLANDPRYLNFQRGSSKIGNGSVSTFAVVPWEAFAPEVYTEAYLALDSTQDLQAYTDVYDMAVEDFIPTAEAVGKDCVAYRTQKIRQEQSEELDEAERAYNDGLAAYQQQIAEAQRQLAAGEAEYEAGAAALAQSEKDYEAGIAEGQKKLEDAQAQLIAGQQAYDEGQAQYNAGVEQTQILQQGLAQIQAQAQGLQAIPEELRTQEQQALLEQLLNRQTQLQAQYDEAVAALEQTKAELEASGQQLETAKQQLQAGKAELQQEKLQGQRELEAAKRQLADSKTQLEQAKARLEQTQAEKSQELEQARQQIEDGREQLAELSLENWYIFDRGQFQGYASLDEDAGRLELIAAVFPVFFLLVALLVCLTTMTRMVEEQRTEIGTYIALGFHAGAVVYKYMIYGASAALLGSVCGTLVGMKLFPIIIINTYKIMHCYPGVTAPYDAPVMLLVTLVAVGVTTVAALAALAPVLRNRPAQLMRPKAPKEGKRIFLERIPFLWKRFNFMAKITSRNLFRYKKRMLMTVVGISGCTALIIAGFALRSSINAIIPLQYGEISTYDMMTVYSESDGVMRVLQDSDAVSETLRVYNETVTVDTADQGYQVTVFVPEDTELLPEMLRLRRHDTGEGLSLPDGYAVINEKLGTLTGLSEQDAVCFTDEDNQEYTIPISGMNEQYAGNTIYMSAETYRHVFGKVPEYNTVLCIMTDHSRQAKDTLAAQLAGQDGFYAVNFSDDLRESFADTMSSMVYVVLIMILMAAMLALVVLYNLTNINIGERIREIATLKVLGFKDREVAQYVFRENAVLTLLGAAAGMALGAVLHSFILNTTEPDMVMFYHGISWVQFVWGVGLTVVFSALVSFILYFKLKRIDMVESLKSVE